MKLCPKEDFRYEQSCLSPVWSGIFGYLPRALLWKATYSSRSSGRGLSLDFGFFPPNEEEEAHLFADELVVHYHNGQPCYADEESCCADSTACTQEDGPYACCKACQESQEAPAPAEKQEAEASEETPSQPEQP